MDVESGIRAPAASQSDRRRGLAAAAVFGVVICWLGVQKFLNGVPDGIASDSVLRYLENAGLWYAIASIEVVGGVLLATRRYRWMWVLALVALGASMALHVVDAGSRGWAASGCGCFGAERLAAGLDLVRTCALFVAALAAYRLAGAATVPSRVLLGSAFIAAVALVFLAPHLWTNPSVPLTDIETHVASVETVPELPPSLVGRAVPAAKKVSPEPDVALDYIVRVTSEADLPLTDLRLECHKILDDGDWKLHEFSDPPVHEGGVYRLVAEDLPSPPFALSAHARGHARRGLVIDDAPTQEESLITLVVARSATIKVESGAGEPLPGVVVELYPVEDHRRRAVERNSLPPLARSAGSAGLATFSNLTPGTTYLVALGPGQGYAQPFGGSVKEYLLEGDEELVLRVRPSYHVWLRLVDAESGAPIRTAAWSLPQNMNRRLSPAHRALGDERRLGIGQRVAQGDFFHLLVLTAGSLTEENQVFATYEASAPGFDPVQVEAMLREQPADSDQGPQVVKMTRSAPLGTVMITVAAQAKVDHLEIQLRSGNWKTKQFLKPRRGSSEASFRVPAGEYALYVGGAHHSDIVVTADTKTRVLLDSKDWAAVSFRVTSDGKPVPGPATLMIASAERRMLMMHGPFALWDGLTQIFAMPRKGPLYVNAWGPGFGGALVEFSVKSPGLNIVEVPTSSR